MGISSFAADLGKSAISNLLGGGPNGAGDANPQALHTGVVQDWTHATKVFVGGDMMRMPKYKGLFHVSLVINPEALKVGLAPLKTTVPRDVLSVLTKSVELPKFTLDYATLNQYNHTTYSYKRIKYDPITIMFHDDMADIVTTFWYFYYAYYFADASKTYNSALTANGGGGLFAGLLNQGVNAISGTLSSMFGNGPGKAAASKLDEYETFRQYANGIMYGKPNTPLTDRGFSWGLNGSAYHLNGYKSPTEAKNVPFLQAIEIYPLGNKKASVIILQNPRIVSWAHDTFDYSANSTATCTASIAYEGVTYSDQIDAKTVLDDVSMYDRHGAPGSGVVGGAFSFLDKVDGILGKAARGDALTGADIITGLGAAKSLARSF